MAKYTPTLLGKDTEINIAPFFGGGFIDAGAAQLNQAVQNNARAITEAKNKKFEQAQALRDGIVSGHFSDIMAAEVGEDIAKLATMGTYSEAYQVTLAEANAKLGINVAKQAQITTGAQEITDQFKEDPSNKYYERNALGANLDDTIEAGGLNTTRNELDKSFEYFKNNTKNIKDGVVRTDFQSKLGEIVEKVEKTGGLSNVNSEFAQFTKTSDGQKFVTGYTYDPVNRMYVPAFDSTKLPPRGLVELYKGIDDAAATLMGEYVNEMHKINADDPTKPITEVAKDNYERRFVLEEMKKLAPGGSMQDIESTEFRGRRAPVQENDSASKLRLQRETNYGSLDAQLNRIEQVLMLDAAQMATNNQVVNYVDVDPTGNGNPVRMIDLSGTQDLDIAIAKQKIVNPQTREITETYVAPDKVYLDIDENSGMNSLYLVTGDPGNETYTVYNDRNVSALALRISNANFGGPTVYKDWLQVSKDRGQISQDGLSTNQSNNSSRTIPAKADGVRKKNDVTNVGAEQPAFEYDTLAATLNTSNKPEIKKALEPVNDYFAMKGYTQKGLTDRDNNNLTDENVKFLRFDQTGPQARDMINTWGKLTYKVIKPNGQLGPEQYAEIRTDEIVKLVSGGGQQTFDLNKEQ